MVKAHCKYLVRPADHGTGASDVKQRYAPRQAWKGSLRTPEGLRGHEDDKTTGRVFSTSQLYEQATVTELCWSQMEENE
jgi:hypothetical protein